MEKHDKSWDSLEEAGRQAPGEPQEQADRSVPTVTSPGATSD